VVRCLSLASRAFPAAVKNYRRRTGLGDGIGPFPSIGRTQTRMEMEGGHKAGVRLRVSSKLAVCLTPPPSGPRGGGGRKGPGSIQLAEWIARGGVQRGHGSIMLAEWIARGEETG